MDQPSRDDQAPAEAIQVRGARVHNLRDVSVDIPRGRLVVLTGVSGSGKSSLAFDTLFAEGQRRYIEGLSVFARQFLDQLERPDVDLIDGLPPTVAIDQAPAQAGPRSTVATQTEIHDFLRLLYARAGVPHCPYCGQPIRRQAPEQIVTSLLDRPEGTKLILLAPLVRGRKGEHAEAFETIRRAGLLRARVDGQVIEIEDRPRLAKAKEHTIEAVVDRLVIRPGIRPRLAESVDRAIDLGGGAVVVSEQSGTDWTDRVFSTRFACPDCGVALMELEPRSFSFNSPHGACPACQGLGTIQRLEPEMLVPDRARSLDSGALAFLDTLPPKSRKELDRLLAAWLAAGKLARSKPIGKWPEAARTALFSGSGEFPGLIPWLEALRSERRAAGKTDPLAAFVVEETCLQCHGARLRPEARAVRLAGKAIHEISALPIDEAAGWFAVLTFPEELADVAPPLVAEIGRRLAYLERVGLGYLTLDRRSETLSGGELQRVRLASQIGSGLAGVAFVLDEPTAGLHPRDTERLLNCLRELRDAGNSVLVVEHDESTIRAADWLIDIGPGAGPDGGQIVAEGPPGALRIVGDSPTARYLADHPPVRVESAPPAAPRSRKKPQVDPRWERWITVSGAREHNLKGDPVKIPVGALTCVTGVSGSGKSTLVLDVLARAARRAVLGAPLPADLDAKINGLDAFQHVVSIDQAPIGRTPRSTPATYTGVFDAIRAVFAQVRESKVRGFTPSRFSFNIKGGRCETCQGQGYRKLEMPFLPDLLIRCEACGGRRFNRSTLEVRYKGLTIAQVLDLRVDEAVAFFDAVPKVLRGLQALRDAGLGYLTLGRPSTTLSGGEAQRVKLSAELGRDPAGRALYILDEPTTGLHFADVAVLLGALRRLAGLGHTLVVIEHNLDVIRAADWVVDLGPEAGGAGGHVVAMGPPEAIAAAAESRTGPYLRTP